MITGAAGALLCVAAGLSLGMAVRERWSARYRLLTQTQEMLAKLRILLSQERLGMCELLEACAEGGGDGMPVRFAAVAAQLRQEPLLSLAEAYRTAAGQTRLFGEGAEEKAALEQLFGDLGMGTAAMREAAAASCLRRLKPAAEEAERRSRTGGRLCVQLGMLAGAMLGIILW
ncbi:MAG: hypothetical protein IKK08_12620 [Clostridia bacterium]|nr:hypothetical protein [Clostridia bacterium]